MPTSPVVNPLRAPATLRPGLAPLTRRPVAPWLALMLGVAGLGLGACSSGEVIPTAPTSQTSSPTAPPTGQSGPSRDSSVGKPQGYTCCNLRHDSDWISDANLASLPMIPAGTPAQVLSYGRYRASVEIGGQRMRLGLDYGRKETVQVYAARLIVNDDPKLLLATYPAPIQRAITTGRLIEGMSREQVLMSVGWPRRDETPDLNAPIWRYRVDWERDYQVHWDAEGRVRALTGTPETVYRIRALHP